LYGISYFYEATGVAYVSLLQYFVVKYAQTQEGNIWWDYLSRPGKYPGNDEANPLSATENGRNFTLSCHDQTMLSSLTISVFLSLFFGLLFSFVSTPLIGFGVAFVVFVLAFTTFAAPNSSRIQVFSWCCIKFYEKSVWAGFVMIQARLIEKWSSQLTMSNKDEEAIIFIAVMPMILNALMFLMFSQISRMLIPFLKIEIKKDPRAPFNVWEALKVGLFYTMCLNMVLYIAAVSAIQTLNSGLLLFVTMLILPLAVAALSIFVADKKIFVQKNTEKYCELRSTSFSNSDRNSLL